nr:GNAT family N-acetyltransferase [uncultured Halomonas sp.]
MLASLERLLRRSDRRAAKSALQPDVSDASTATPMALEPAREEDIDMLLDAACRAGTLGHAPWILRNQTQIDTLKSALEFTVHRGLWLQRGGDGVAHWQGRLLALRPADATPMGLLLVCRPDDEAAWQLRFFCINTSWQGGGHGARLLQIARRHLNGVPLRACLPLSCSAAIKSLEAAGFARMHVDASEIASFEAPAAWD